MLFLLFDPMVIGSKLSLQTVLGTTWYITLSTFPYVFLFLYSHWVPPYTAPNTSLAFVAIPFSFALLRMSSLLFISLQLPHIIFSLSWLTPCSSKLWQCSSKSRIAFFSGPEKEPESAKQAYSSCNSSSTSMPASMVELRLSSLRWLTARSASVFSFSSLASFHFIFISLSTITWGSCVSTHLANAWKWDWLECWHLTQGRGWIRRTIAKKKHHPHNKWSSNQECDRDDCR